MSSEDHREQTARIRKKLARVREADRDLKVFGANTHRYEIGPPVSEAEIEAFEARHGVVLPSAYVAFLTQVGNGGVEWRDPEAEALREMQVPKETSEFLEALLGTRPPDTFGAWLDEITKHEEEIGPKAPGPAYGIYALGEGNGSWIDASPGFLATPPAIHPELSDTEWRDLTRRIVEPDVPRKIMESELNKIYSGLLLICDHGCANHSGLVVAGEHHGRMVNLVSDFEKPTFCEEPNFLDWYESWLDEVLVR